MNNNIDNMFFENIGVQIKEGQCKLPFQLILTK